MSGGSFFQVGVGLYKLSPFHHPSLFSSNDSTKLIGSLFDNEKNEANNLVYTTTMAW